MTPDPLILIERAARTCYQSEPKEKCEACGGNFTPECPRCAALAASFVVPKVIKAGHESVIEHAVATFWTNTERAVSHELVRHRISSYSQSSTRFCNYGTKDGGIKILDEWPFNSEGRQMSDADLKVQSAFHEALIAIEKAYKAGIGAGMQPQWARRILPLGLNTQIVFTMNFRELRHVIKLRRNGAGGTPYPVIKDAFDQVLKLLLWSPAAPLFADLA
jgi:thymidylate synthase (FAD)